MKYQHGILFLIVIFFGSCEEELSYEDFKAKYKWEEVVSSLEYDDKLSGLFCVFEFQGKIYKPYAENSYLSHHDQFMVLFDVNAPDKNFIIQLDRPIKPEAIQVVKTIGKIQSAYKTTNYVVVDYKFKTNVKYDLMLRPVPVEEHWKNATDYLSLSSYDKLKKIQEQNLMINVDFFIKEFDKNGYGEGSILINREDFDIMKL